MFWIWIGMLVVFFIGIRYNPANTALFVVVLIAGLIVLSINPSKGETRWPTATAFL